jgi:flagellar biosynthesis chaperone FliJ
VRIQQEEAIRPELMRLSQEIALVHSTMFARQASLRNALAGLCELPVADRLTTQQEFMRLAAVEEQYMDRLREELKGLQDIRQEKIDEFNQLRTAREALEKLREKALSQHIAEMGKLEQKELDENSRQAFSRGIIEQRTVAAD